MEEKINSISQEEKLKNKIESWLLWWAIGDALGAPVEMTTKEQIFAKHGRVEDYLPIKNNMFFNKHWFESDEGGRVTDDTILTFALIKSYNELERLDLDDIFKKHQEEYDKFPYGFGSATRFGMQNIKEGMSLQKSWMKDSAGNGVVMKQFPLAAIASVKNISDENMAELINTYTRATHNSDIAVVASLVHHKFLKLLLETQPKKLHKMELLHQLIEFILPYEQQYPQAENNISDMLTTLSTYINETGAFTLNDDDIIELFGRGKLDENNPRDIFKSGYVLSTLWIVYALFLRGWNFEALINAVNIGWDTDSYAAIMGNMMGAYQWIEYEKNISMACKKKKKSLPMWIHSLQNYFPNNSFFLSILYSHKDLVKAHKSIFLYVFLIKTFIPSDCKNSCNNNERLSPMSAPERPNGLVQNHNRSNSTTYSIFKCSDVCGFWISFRKILRRFIIFGTVWAFACLI